MKTFLSIIIVLAVLGILFYVFNKKETVVPEVSTPEALPVTVIPISHATAVLTWGDKTIYTDPTGGAEAFTDQLKPQLIVVTDIHGDHFSAETLGAVVADANIIVPQAVKDLLPEDLMPRAIVLGNGEATTEQGFQITAIPMYNTPESSESRHAKGRGNGYVIERDGFRVYVAGDTSGTPEMRALTDIDIALVPMNLPYTMSVEEAADVVLAFKPRHVYPYHYRGQEGLSDVNQFKALVNAGDPNIDVVLLNWYPEQ